MNSFTQFVASHSISLKVFLQVKVFFLLLPCSSQYMRSLNNFRAEQPHQHAMYYLRLLMTEVAWTKDELREALDGGTQI